MRHYLIVIIGTSGSGKTELNKLLGQRMPTLKRIISCTTRAPRVEKGEVDGVDYRFFSEKTFLEKKEQRLFVETDQPFIKDVGSPHQFDWYGRLLSDFAALETSHCYADMTEAGVLALQNVGVYEAVYIRLIPANKTVTERDRGRANGDAERAAIPIRVDYVVANDHALPLMGGIEKAFREVREIIEQYTHPEG